MKTKRTSLFLFSLALLLSSCGNEPGSSYASIIGMSKVTAGSYHTCALTTAGTVKCWGNNVGSQLGDLSTNNSLVAVKATAAPTGVTDLAVGNSHTCVIANNGIQCWGGNSNGQLGNETTTSSTTAVTPTGLSSGISAISASDVSSCAVQNGALYCWGGNSRGAVGDGTVISRTTPTAASTLASGVAAVSGFNEVCGIKSGAAYCWGFCGLDSGLAQDATSFYSSTPLAVGAASSGVTAIAAQGAFHYCAIQNGGAICWGENSFGQLGNGTTTNSLDTAVPVSNLNSGVTAISTGGANSCAIANNEVYCWGNNSAGQLANGNLVSSTVPVQISSLTGATSLSVGKNYVCVVVGAVVKCWGINTHGQLGNGTTTNVASPTQVVEGSSQQAQMEAPFLRHLENFGHTLQILWKRVRSYVLL